MPTLTHISFQQASDEAASINYQTSAGNKQNQKPLTKLYTYTGCPRGNVPDLGRMFLTLKYTDITQDTYVYPKLNGYGDNGERSLKV